MSIYKSEQVAYSPLKKKNVPIWKLDTNSMNVTLFNPDTLGEERKTYHTVSSGIIFIIQIASTLTDFAGS